MTKIAPIKDRKIRVALVGCGRISKNHFDAINVHEDRMELVDICDIDADALKVAEEVTGATGHSDIDALLKSTSADAVILTTPSGVHAEHAIKVAEAGLHVISEKPMATNWEDGLAMNKVCEDENVHLFVVKLNRRNATLQMLKQAVDEGRFGRIFMVNINVFWTRPQEYYDAADWRGTWEMDGGALMNQASHYVDLLSWIIGPIDSIHAFAATLDRQIEAEDTAALNLRWKSGALGSMNVTMLTHPKNLEGSITILGEKGTAKIGGVAVNKIEHWEFADKAGDDDNIADASYETTSVYGFGHPLYYDNVIQVLNGDALPQTSGRDGLESLEILVAAYRSAKEGRPVSLPLER